MIVKSVAFYFDEYDDGYYCDMRFAEQADNEIIVAQLDGTYAQVYLNANPVEVITWTLTNSEDDYAELWDSLWFVVDNNEHLPHHG